jgi:hypothetical protein
VTVPDTILTLSAAALPGGYLWDQQTDIDPDDLVLFDGAVPPTPPKRYAVAYMDPGTLKAVAACGRSDSVTFRWQVTSVGPDRQQAAWVAVKVRDGTVDTRPVLAGWSFGLICHNYAQLPQRDEAVAERPQVYAVDLYDLLATRL